MVNGVAHQVHQRIVEFLKNGFVDLGVLPHKDQFDVLSELPPEIACKTDIFLEHAPNRLHARLHHCALQVTDQHVELTRHRLERLGRFVVALYADQRGRQACQTRAGEADFTRKVEDLVKTRSVDA